MPEFILDIAAFWLGFCVVYGGWKFYQMTLNALDFMRGNDGK